MMTKEEVIDYIVERYKGLENKGRINIFNCCHGIDCDYCPFDEYNCDGDVAMSLLERLLKAEEHQETNLEHYVAYYNNYDQCIYMDAVKLTNEAHRRLNNFEDAIEWLLEPYKPPKFKLTQFGYDLLDFCKQYNDELVIEDWAVLKDMHDKGHYKGIPKETKIRDIIDNCEVIDSEQK